MSHATRDAIEHARDALDDLTANYAAVDCGVSQKDIMLGVVARAELQKLLDTGLDADLAALRQRCAELCEADVARDRNFRLTLAGEIRALPLHPPDEPTA